MGLYRLSQSKKKILKTGADVYELMNDYPVHTKTVLIDNRLSVVGLIQSGYAKHLFGHGADAGN